RGADALAEAERRGADALAEAERRGADALATALGETERRGADALGEAERRWTATDIEISRRVDQHTHRLNVLEDALQYASPKVDRLERRLETVRFECLHELRAGRDSSAGKTVGAVPPIVARVLEPEKLARQRAAGGLRLNLGCGHLPDEDRINVDARELPGVDLVADITRLPLEPGGVAEIYSAHVLEHFPEEDLRRIALPHWFELLASGGRFSAVVPDAVAMLEAYQRGEMNFADLRTVMFGGQEYAGDFHFTMFSPESLSALLAAAGFQHIECPVRSRGNGLCLEMQVTAIKP
nr:hypothetical protein [Candidatus Contendobacter sp.]